MTHASPAGTLAIGLFMLLAPQPRPAATRARPRPPLQAIGDLPMLPDRRRTPGAVLDVTAKDICVPGYTKKVRNVPATVKKQVYESYGIRTHPRGAFEVDHLISLELGGSNAVANLWPESYRTSPWNAKVKDALENKLHRMVCANEIDLPAAQRAIAVDWIGAYKQYFHRDLPEAVRTHPRRRRRRS
ncbi:MAG: HNH endonuclease [Gemmatimonadota bacterium]|nr:HNH endonuclease [Gemmatimonadota bacterium]